MSTENGAKQKQHQVDGTSHPVVDIEELDKELRLRSRNRKMQRERENSKENLKKSELRELLNNVSEGNVVKLCTCQQSKDFPYCDNTHEIFNKATNSHLSPLYVAFVEGKRVCNDCGSKLKKSCSHTQDNSTAPESPGCSITLSDCTNTDSSILDTDPPTTSTSSTSISSTSSTSTSTSISSPPTSPTLTVRRRSTIRKSADSTRQSIPPPTSTSSYTTNSLSTSRNTDTTSRDSINRDTTSTTSINTTSRDTTSTTSSSASRDEGVVDITLPHSSDPEEDEDHNTITTNDNSNTEGKDESKTITPPPVILATTRNEESEEKATITTREYIPSSIKDPRNRDNIISKYEVSQHNTQTDLWMIIKGNVYDITKYVKSHPGGVRALVKFAGKDGTENVQYHSSAMLEILNSHYFIGRLPKEEGGPGGGCIIC